MKRSFKMFCIATAAIMTLAAQSCKKPKEPSRDEPCKNAVRVTALETDYYYTAQFSLQDQGGNLCWLYATNWIKYSDKVIPGHQYEIAYKEVPCNDLYPCGDYKPIAPGGCFPQLKCIEIICLREATPRCPVTGCLNTEITDTIPEYGQGNISNASISGDRLSATIGFSGCSDNDYRYFRLVLSPSPASGPYPTFEAKAVDTREVTCLAVFQHETCFDLAAIRSYYSIRNIVMPKAVNIMIVNADGSNTALVYHP